MIKAETIQALDYVGSGYSFSSANNDNEKFRQVSPDSAIPKAHKQAKIAYVIQHGIAPYIKEMVLAEVRDKQTETKIAYVIQHGIAPYIKEMVLAEVRDKQTETKIAYVIQHGIAPYIKEMVLAKVRDKPFTFKFDETTTEQIKKTI